jgi:hypothetical protein
MVSVGNGVPRSYFHATISDCGLSLSALCAGLLRFGNATLSNSFPQKVKATYLDIPSESRIYKDIFSKCTDSIRGAARGSAGRTRSRWPPSPGGRARRYPGSGAPGSRTGGRGRTWHRLGTGSACRFGSLRKLAPQRCGGLIIPVWQGATVGIHHRANSRLPRRYHTLRGLVRRQAAGRS